MKKSDEMSLNAHHYGVTVSDMEEAVDFYAETLGLEVVDRFRESDEAFNEAVGTAGVEAELLFMDAGGCLVELLEYVPTGDDVTGASSNDVGASHFCLEVDDVFEWYESLDDSVEFVSEPKTISNGATIVYMHDPDGNVVELVEE